MVLSVRSLDHKVIGSNPDAGRVISPLGPGARLLTPNKLIEMNQPFFPPKCCYLSLRSAYSVFYSLCY